MDTILDNLTPEKATDEQVIAQAVKAAKSFSELWNDQGKWLVELKARFQVRQGSRGKQLPVEGKKLPLCEGNFEGEGRKKALELSSLLFGALGEKLRASSP